MLVDDPDRDETATPVKHDAFSRRIQDDGPWLCGREQCIHEPRSVTAALSGLRDDDHPGGSMRLPIRPPSRGTDHHAGALQNKAVTQLQREIPILEPIGPRHFLRELQGAFQMCSGEWKQDRVLIDASAGLVSCGCHHGAASFALLVRPNASA
jgi:hypothetical protein